MQYTNDTELAKEWQ